MRYVKRTIKCPNCGKLFNCTFIEQEPGFRDIEELRCPYCKVLLTRTNRFDFWVEPIEDNELLKELRDIDYEKFELK